MLGDLVMVIDSRVFPADRRDLVAALCRQHGVRRLALFGSATTDRFDPATSDFDFAVEFAEMSPSDHARNYFELLEQLESGLQRKVDLVELDAVTNPYFRAELLANMIPLYAA